VDSPIFWHKSINFWPKVDENVFENDQSTRPGQSRNLGAQILELSHAL